MVCYGVIPLLAEIFSIEAGIKSLTSKYMENRICSSTWTYSICLIADFFFPRQSTFQEIIS